MGPAWSGKDLDGLRASGLPEGDAPVLAGCDEAAAIEGSDGIHRTVVETKDREGRPLVDRP